MPSRIRSTTEIVATTDETELAKKLPIKMVASVIKNGNLPLQGTKLFVKTAIKRSRGESIILHPTTPAALQPNPIHIVRACFPEVQHFLKHLSKLKAILGRYPKSSKKVNKGKKIAIGGSITAITQDNVVYTPSIKIPLSHIGLPK